MDLVLKILAVAIAVFALLTAVVTHKIKRLEYDSARSASMRATDGTALSNIKYDRSKRWPWALLKWSLLLVGAGGIVLLLISESALDVVLSLAILAGSVYSFRALRHEPWRKASVVRRGASIVVQGSFESVFRRCARSLQVLNARRIELDESVGMIRARTPWTWWGSWGEKIEIRVKALDSNSTSVQFVSDSVLPTTIVDFGRNSRNLERLIAAI